MIIAIRLAAVIIVLKLLMGAVFAAMESFLLRLFTAASITLEVLQRAPLF
ncbi:MAG: hypothetical protein HYT12_01720 [Candidatus Liptonbacteria bacterium]|nr:hypothetical protein [Candidatus Liptonbacteria bacterium]